jgi:cupin fold WbuC family metalloprotein
MNEPANCDLANATALPAPTGDVIVIDEQVLADLCNKARSNRRRRIILPLHKSLAATTHRMLNAIQPDSYIPPHRHLDPPKSESVIVLQGVLVVFVFDLKGNITAMHRLAHSSPQFGIDIASGLFHTFVAMVADTVIFEVKPGPYEQTSDKDIALWAPCADSPAARDYLTMLHNQAGSSRGGSKGSDPVDHP